MRNFDYERPERVEEALEALGPGIRPYAGGTDLLPLMKADLFAPRKLVDVKRALMAGIAPDGQGISIGPLTVLDDLENDPSIRKDYSALADACAAAASPQLRNRATIGGNLLQRPRCWYFRNPRVHCWLKGGHECTAEGGDNRRHALFGDTPCRAVHPSDPAAALVALNAGIRIHGARGERSVPAEDFFVLPRDDRRVETVLEEDELIVGIRIPAPAPGARSTYLKAMERKTWSFALVGVAAMVRLSAEKVVDDARIVLSGVAPIPWTVPRAESILVGKTLEERTLLEAGEAAIEGASPLIHNGHKLPLVRALVKRALERLA